MKYPIDTKELKRLQSFGKSKVVQMTPDEFLAKNPGIFMAFSKTSYDKLKGRMEKGGVLDPLWMDVDCNGNSIKHEGRHRALVALCLGIKTVPVIVFDKCETK